MIPAQLPAHNPRILVLRLDRLGDVVLSTPVVTAIRTAHPNAHITMVVRPECRDAVEGLSALNHVVLYDKVGRERSPWGTVQFAWRLRAARFDAVLVLHPSHRSHWLAWWMGVPVRIGWNRKSGWLLTHRVPHNKQAGEQHEAQYSLDLLHYIGIRSTELMPDFPHHHEASRAIETWLAKHQIPLDRKLITIHPSASCISKRWPAARFAEVADALMRDDDCTVIIVAGPSDHVVGDAVAHACRQPVLNASGEMSIAELSEILRRSALLISNDSGPVHVAVAVGTPVVDIFGRNQRGLSPKRWGPLGPHDQVLHKEVGCDRCLAHDCDIAFQCLTEISVAEVLSAARATMAAAQAVQVSTP